MSENVWKKVARIAANIEMAHHWASARSNSSDSYNLIEEATPAWIEHIKKIYDNPKFGTVGHSPELLAATKEVVNHFRIELAAAWRESP